MLALDALPALTARPDQVKQLRQTILNLAVRGKLVPQDPKDEPASELLKRIAVEFAQLVRDGEMNKPKPVKAISNRDQLFPLPSGWELARFNQIASIQSNLVDPKRYKEMPHIAPDNIESWTARLMPYVSIGEAGVFSGKHLGTTAVGSGSVGRGGPEDQALADGSANAGDFIGRALRLMGVRNDDPLL